MALREPIPVAPFLAWAQRREQQIRREIDHYPAISGSRDGGVEARGPMNIDPRGRLVMELGWDADSGTRLLFRWQHETPSGLVERARVEEALFCAGVDFYELYPDMAPSNEPADRFCPRCRHVVPTVDMHCAWCNGPVNERRYYSVSRIGTGSKMTDAQIRAAHVIYASGVTLQRVAEMIWENYGYASVESCATGLHKAWHLRGLPQRPKEEVSRATHTRHGMTAGRRRTTEYWKMQVAALREQHGTCEHVKANGEPCGFTCRPGETTCGYHTPDSLDARRRRMAEVQRIGVEASRMARAA